MRTIFTGIIEELGSVKSLVQSKEVCRLTILAPHIMKGTALGDSIAVNGICLTVEEMGENWFRADVMAETMRRTSLSGLSAGSLVNLERAMPMNGRFGGHIVSGHVDGTGTVLSVKKEGNAFWYEIQAEPSILKYVIEKGSIAIDGISLTVAKVTKKSFSVSIIPHTRKMTVLSERKPGDLVNLENDLIGKYVERLLGFQEEKKQESHLSMDFLAEHGFL